MSARERMEQRRQSAAKRWAQQRGAGFETTMFRMPENLNFFKLEKGRKRISIIPFIAGAGNPYAEKGEETFERTFYAYSKIGADEKRYVAPGKTANQRDYVAEYVQQEARKPDHDKELLKALAPKERQAFLVFDHDDPDKGLQLFELSYHKFGKLLRERVTNADESKGWDFFYLTDDDGFMLELTVVDTGTFGLEVKAIDFEKRRAPLPESVVKHNICLDDLLVILPYEELKARFLMLTDEQRSSEGSEPRVNPAKTPDAPVQERRTEPEPVKSTDAVKPVEETKPVVTAHSLGLAREDRVMYNGKALTVLRISEDGLSLSLLDEATDDIIKPVNPADVKPVNRTEAKPTEPVQQQQTQPSAQTATPPKNENPPFDPEPKKDASSGDDAWDEDWK